jgi:hypothetical protein
MTEQNPDSNSKEQDDKKWVKPQSIEGVEKESQASSASLPTCLRTPIYGRMSIVKLTGYGRTFAS